MTRLKTIAEVTLKKSGLSGMKPAFAYIFIALSAIVIPQAFYGSYYAVHHDLAGSVLSGRLATDLAENFRDYSVYFPPVELVWFSLASRISYLSGLRLDLAAVLMTSAIVLISTMLAYRIRRDTVGASLLFLLFPIVLFLVLPVLFKNVFGLREHIVALGMWPYLVLRISDPDENLVGWKTWSVVGVWLGMTLLFKYLYAVAVLLFELVDAVVQRRPLALLRMENLISGAVVAAYLFLWLGLDPSQREAIVAVRSAIDANLLTPRKNLIEAISFLYLVPFFVAWAMLYKCSWRDILCGLALVVGAIFAAAVQARWYSHHDFPVVLAYIAWWWMIAARIKWWGHIIIAALLTLQIIPQFIATVKYQAEVHEINSTMERAKLSIDGKRVGLLSVHPSPYNEFLAANGGIRWVVSINNSYVASELENFDTKSNAGRLHPPIELDDPGRRMLHEDMLRFWEDMPPEALILDRGKSWPLKHINIDWVQAFSKDERFNEILEDYRPVLEHDGKRLRFTYYVRIEKNP